MASSDRPFRNLKPLTRAERLALKDKVALEKERLWKRNGLAAKMYRENAPKTSNGLITPEADAAGFLSDADRFHTDVCGEERVRRREKYEKEQLNYCQKRVQNVRREEERWERLQEQKKVEEAYWARQRELGDKSRKNNSSVPHDIVTLTYSPGLEGERLRFKDDEVRYRAAIRSINLQRNGDTRAGYNIINGDDVYAVPDPHDQDDSALPVKPTPHPVLKLHIDKCHTN